MAGRVTVVGAGVIGLSCAVRLAEAGVEVNVLARELPLETMSATDPGLWLPPLAAASAALLGRARATLTELTKLTELGAATTPDGGSRPAGSTGVRTTPGTVLTPDGEPPAWAAALADVVRLTPTHEPGPGYRAVLPTVDLPRYLTGLVDRLTRSGGTLTRLPLTMLPSRGIVVNCTGLAARALARDPDVRPVRGQSLLVANPGLDRWWWAEDGVRLTYVVPRGPQVLLGGTLDDEVWDTTPDPAAARDILARAAELVPELSGARVLGHRVGLRPTRPTVRLELEVCPTEDDPDHVRIHCYGHGVSGLTVSWGCADEVYDAVTRRVPQPQLRW
jgi:D-amino-acid oxidase